MDEGQRIDLVFTGDPVLSLVFLGLLFVLFIMILEAGMKK